MPSKRPCYPTIPPHEPHLMFPHHKLDWTISRLEKQLEAMPDDTDARLELCRAGVSRARWHGGGEMWFNKALTHARRVLQHDPTNPGALVVTGLALVALDRGDMAARYLDEAQRVGAERADVHFALGEMHRANRDRHQAVREYQTACRIAPESWETHSALGQVLQERADELGRPRRLTERSQFHLVRALQFDPTPDAVPAVLHDLGVSCLRTGRVSEAHRLFMRLLESPSHRRAAQYFLGLVSYRLGKYKNAILYFRQHLKPPDAHIPAENERTKADFRHPPTENPQVWTRIGMAYLQLGEPAKAREACHKALTIEPTDLLARWALGCSLVEEGQEEDAVRVFREMLEDAPDHVGAFAELVSIRAHAGDPRWLQQALRSEVAVYDRLPASALREDPNLSTHKVRISPRHSTRERIHIVLNALREIDGGASAVALKAMDLTSDEGLRFLLWESALEMLATQRAAAASARLNEPRRNYGASAGREILVLSDLITEQALTHGLNIGEPDLKRAAVDRHGPVSDVGLHRVNIDRERKEARAWQALLLLAVTAHRTPSGRNLLLRWAAEADPELAIAAQAGLAALGDPDATEAVRERAVKRGAGHLVDRLSGLALGNDVGSPPRVITDEEQRICATCGRRTGEVHHFIAGPDAAVCNECLADIARDRRNLATIDPTIRCALSGVSLLDVSAMYMYRAVPVSSDCVDQSLGLQEREAVDRYLATC